MEVFEKKYTIKYVDEKNPYMKKAKEIAQKESQDPQHKTGAVIVKFGKIIGTGANGSLFHNIIGCPRKWFSIKTGKGYGLCPGCNPNHHAEQTALRNAKISGKNPQNADLYLYGHWWCCDSCSQKMIHNQIKTVYLLENADTLFKK